MLIETRRAIMPLPLSWTFACRRFVWLLVPVLAVLAAGCDIVGETPDRDFDPDRTFVPTAEVSGMAPAASALAGVDEVVLSGANFSSVLEENFVYFGSIRADVISASPTELRVVPPLASAIVPDGEVSITVPIRVSVLGAELYSEAVTYTLFDPAPQAVTLASIETIFSITTDASGVLYASLAVSGNSVGINRVDSEGEFELFLDNNFLWSGLGFDATSALYGTRNVRAVFKADPGSTFSTFGASRDRSVRMTTLDVLSDGTVWAAGDNTAVFGIAADGTVSSYDFEANVVDIKVVGNALKLLVDPGLEDDDTRGIYSAPIDPASGALQANPTLESDLSSLPFASVSTFAWATSGEVFVGGDADVPVYVGTPGGTFAPLFPQGVVLGEIVEFAWGESPTLYGVRSFLVGPSGEEEPRSAIYAINTRDRVGI